MKRADVTQQVPVVILDFGSQFTQLIARRVRELGVYCEIHPCTMPLGRVRAMEPRAIVLSGGPASVLAKDAPLYDAAVFELGVPVLGICYGQQLMAHLLGGRVEPGTTREYGAAKVTVGDAVGPFHGFRAGDVTEVWMSHGVKLAPLPPGFRAIASSEYGALAAMADPDRRLYALQFHPEVHHTPEGEKMLASFLFDVAGVAATWTPGHFVEESIARVRAQVGGRRAVCGLSGGVDSSVAAVLCHRAIGDRLTCIYVDNGVMRTGETDEVVRVFRDHFHLDLRAIDARIRFLDALRGVTDPEQKRKIIGRVFIEVFEEEAAKLEDVGFLVQGTLYPDVIESVSFKGPSAVIKSHHNVGGLPERMKLALVEPLRELFKDEVRAVGRELGMPPRVLGRQPFPGPGLAIRVIGEVTDERLVVLREADSIVDHEIRAAGEYDQRWQTFAVLLPIRTVGVMGDERTYDQVIAIRSVDSRDGMTADWSRLPYELLGRMANRIINEVRGVNRVVYDISSKPPSTIEWE